MSVCVCVCVCVCTLKSSKQNLLMVVHDQNDTAKEEASSHLPPELHSGAEFDHPTGRGGRDQQQVG